jgi:hypothetical protein
MLSVSECRRLLGTHSRLSDLEVEEIRDQLYELANLILDDVSTRRTAEGEDHQLKMRDRNDENPVRPR